MPEALLDPLVSIVAGSAVGIALVDMIRLLQRLRERGKPS